MGAASLRRGTIANASQLPLLKVVKRYCAPVSGAISSTMPLPLPSLGMQIGTDSLTRTITLDLLNPKLIGVDRVSRTRLLLCQDSRHCDQRFLFYRDNIPAYPHTS